MTRKVIEDGNRRVILEEDEVIIQNNGNSIAVRAEGSAVDYSDQDRVEENRANEAHPQEGRGHGVGVAAVRVIATVLLLAGVAFLSLLVARLVLLAAGADPANQAVDTVYAITAPTVEPFEGIFSVQALEGGIFEPAAAIAAGLALLAMLAIAALSRTALRRARRDS